MSDRPVLILWLLESLIEELRGLFGKGVVVGCWDEHAGVRGSATWEAQNRRQRRKTKHLKIRVSDMMHSHFIDSIKSLQQIITIVLS